MEENIYMVIKKAKPRHSGGFTVRKAIAKAITKPSWNYTILLLYFILIILTIYLIYDLRYN